MSVVIDRSTKFRVYRPLVESKRLTEREGLVIASAEARTAAIAIRENFILNRFLRELIRSFESVFVLNKLKNYVVTKECKYGWQLMNFTSDSYRLVVHRSFCRGFSHWRSYHFSCSWIFFFNSSFPTHTQKRSFLHPQGKKRVSAPLTRS